MSGILHSQPGRRVTDWGRMESATVRHVAVPETEQQLQEIVREAAAEKLKISQRGAGHSAGGQSFVDDGVMIDVRRLDRILDLDEQNRTVRVQGGASWKVLTDALEPLRLAVTTKQEFDLFTVGGSVACNVHGKSVDYGPLIESIRSFRLLQADGEIVNVSREENASLFPAVVGGYGLFGIVVDVDLDLVPDRPVRKDKVVAGDLATLAAQYAQRLAGDRSNLPLCYGFLDVECTHGFYIPYVYADDQAGLSLKKLKRHEIHPALFNSLVKLQRTSRFVRRKTIRLMEKESGRAEVTLRSRRLLLWEDSPKAFGGMLFQKFYVPVDAFAEFAARVGRVFQRYGDELQVLTNHFRFVPGNGEAMLSFSPEDSICMIPCYLANKDSTAWQNTLKEASHELMSAVLDLGGSHYLTFDALASPEEVRRGYPRWDEFVELKRKHDPGELFSSTFYQRYASPPSAGAPLK